MNTLITAIISISVVFTWFIAMKGEADEQVIIFCITLEAKVFKALQIIFFLGLSNKNPPRPKGWSIQYKKWPRRDFLSLTSQSEAFEHGTSRFHSLTIRQDISRAHYQAMLQGRKVRKKATLF